MNVLPPSRPLTADRFRAAFSVLELMIAGSMGGIILAAVLSLFTFSTRSFVAIGNYIELDQSSRNALDHLSRDIRQAAALKEYSNHSLTFTNADGSELEIRWDPSSRELTETKGNITKTLLTECDIVEFNISQRSPSNGVFGFYPASDPSLCKLVDMRWRCSRTMLGKKFHTESVQTAKIVIRN